MKKTFIYATLITGLAIFSSCSEKKENNTSAEKANTTENTDTLAVAGKVCDVKFGGINFTSAINGADTLVHQDGGKLVFNVAGEKDYFSDPDGKLSNTSSPILLTQIDNTKPFTFTGKVTPSFTKDGMYNAGVLFLYASDALYQKFCFEQSEDGRHRIVTVRTQQTSDDNNHDVVTQPFVYMKISSDTKTVASYYSLDNKKWQMVRLYKNNYPASFYLGISAQCPVDKAGSSAVFEELSLTQTNVNNFRTGE